MASLEATEAIFKKVAKEHGRLVTVTYMSGSTVEDQLITNVMVVTGTGIGVTILRAFMTAFFIFSKIKRPQPSTLAP